MEGIKTNRLLKIKIYPNRLLAVLPCLYYIANLLFMLNIIDTLYRITLVAVGVIGIAYLFFQRNRNLIAIHAYILCYVLSLMLNWLIIQNNRPIDITMNLLLFGVFTIMICLPWNLMDGAIVFYISAILIIYNMSISVTKRILSSSSNYTSIVMLLACSFYYLALERDKGKVGLLDLIPAVICFNISIWAEGRGGIISCTFLLLMMVIIYIKTTFNKNAIRVVILAGIIICVVASLYINNYHLIDSYLELGKFAKKGLDNSDRLYIWTNYILKTKESIIYFLLGAPLDQIMAIIPFKGNVHNSFLQLHAYCGIMIIVITSILICKSLIYYIKNKQYISAVIMFVIILRGMSDKFVFGQYGMPIMLFIIFFPYISSENFVHLDYQNFSEELEGKYVNRESIIRRL